MLFPNTVANAPASNVSIEYGLKGPNITFVQRFCSAESAVLAACRFIEEGRADVMLAGGVDELTPLMMKGFAALGQLHSHASGFGEGCRYTGAGTGRPCRQPRAQRSRPVSRAITTVGLLLPGCRTSRGSIACCQPQRCFDQLIVSGAETAVRAVAGMRSGPSNPSSRAVDRSFSGHGGRDLGGLDRITAAWSDRGCTWPPRRKVPISPSP